MGSLRRQSIAVCGLVALLAFSATPAQAAFPGKNGKIAFVSDRDREIYSINPDGTGETRVTHSGLANDVPAWSPDGSKIAFARFFGTPGLAPDRWDTFTMNADGSGETNLARTLGVDFSYDPAWSPDGRKIALSLSDFGVPNGIYIVNSDGTERTFLTAGSKPAWSPNGTKIAFVRFECCPGVGSIWTVNPDGTGETRLTDGPGAWAPDWSSDGTKIAFTRGADIYVMNADGTGQANLTNNPAGTYPAAPAWSPDGTKIAFTSYRSDIFNPDIYTMNADGTGQTRVTTNPDSDYAPDWQPIPGPKRSDYKNAAQFCKAEQAFWGDQFASRYGGRADSYGKCVSQSMHPRRGTTGAWP